MNMFPFPSSREMALLIACVRPKVAVEEVRSCVAKGVDWDRVLRLAEQQGVRPRLFQGLDSAARALVPTVVMHSLQSVVAQSTASNLLMAEELASISEAMQARGVAMIAYKGGVMAELFYGGLALREFDDLDILVHACDVVTAVNLLRDLGYVPAIHLTASQEAMQRAGACELLMVRERGRYLVDLHWQIAPPYFSVPVNVEHFFQRSVPAQLGAAKVRTFTPEDLLLVLSVHAAKHGWRHLKWICDLAQLMNVPGLDWVGVMREAKVARARRLVLVALRLASDVFRMGLPEEIWAATRDSSVSDLAAAVLSTFEQGTRDIPNFGDHLLALRARESWGTRLRYVLRFLTASGIADWQEVRLPRPVRFAYPAVRVWRRSRDLLLRGQR